MDPRPCPLCGTNETTPYVYKTYATCTKCQHTYQPQPPDKVWRDPSADSSDHNTGYVMDDHERNVNRYLANWLYLRYKPRATLDIGCGYPYLVKCFQDLNVHASGTEGFTGITNDLDVEVWNHNWEDETDQHFTVDLITMIHVIEHFTDPITALSKAYNFLTPEGVLYLRAPNKDVRGIERDHTEGHARIHPSIFGTESLLYAAKQAGFHLIWMEHMDGAGQTSWIFRKRPPKISLCMIVKNEEHNIVECLHSVRDFCDEMIVVDTGSTDETVMLATENGATVYGSRFFGPDTTYKEFDFSKARNESLSYATGDWIFWMDADDRFYGRPTLQEQIDAYDIELRYGNTTLTHCRFFRNGWGVHFSGAIHETPVVHHVRRSVKPMGGCHVVHLTTDKPGRCERNLEILEGELLRKPQNKRTMFYLGNTYREVGQVDKAIELYRRYLSLGGNFADEKFLAQYYIAMAYFQKNDWNNAIREAHIAISMDDRWAEPYCCIGESYFQLKQYERAISYLEIAMRMPIPKTLMFVRTEMYGPVPQLWISRCYEELGQYNKAIEYAGDDLERISYLRQRVYVIEVHRPGALGDVLATTPAVRELRRKFPEAHIRYITHPSSKKILECNPDINEVTDEQGKWADKRINFSYPMHLGYPNTPMQKHLAEYFADCAGVTLSSDWRPILNLIPDGDIKLELTRPMVTFAVRTGWSRYKEWPLDRWVELIKRFPEYQWVQIGGPGEPQVEGALYTCGKFSLRESFILLKKSYFFVGLDSVFNHAANALQVPAIIMFGSTSPMGSGYLGHINLASGDSCQPCYREDNSIAVHKKPPCPYSHKCMIDYMTVDRVEQAIKTGFKAQ